VTEAASQSYVAWYNVASGGQWAAWPPGEMLNPGDIGTFDAELSFHPRGKLSSFGVAVQVSAERQVRSGLYRSEAGLQFHNVSEHAVRVIAEEPGACILQLIDATEKSVLNREDVLDDIRMLLVRGRWDIDAQVVMGRTRSRGGFCAVSLAAGASLELVAAGDRQAIAEAAELDGAQWSLVTGQPAAGFSSFEFSDPTTAVFSPPVRVRHELWHWLLPWLAEENQLVDPTGRRYAPGDLPHDLSDLPPESRRYDPARSALRPAALSAMPLAEVFEEVTSPPELAAEEAPDQDAPTYLPEHAPGVFDLRAGAGALDLPKTVRRPGDRPVVLFDTASPDGLADFTLHDRGRGEFWIEVSLGPAIAPPAVVALRYATADGRQQELLVPVDDDGSGLPSSVAELPDYAIGASCQAFPVRPADLTTWPEEVLARSVKAVVTASAAQAWHRIAQSAGPDAGPVVARNLDAVRNRR